MESSRLKKLIKRYQSGTASPVERYIVDRWLESFQEDNGERHSNLEEAEYVSLFQRRTLDRAFAASTPRIDRQYRWARWAVAVLVLIVASLSLLFYTWQSDGSDQASGDDTRMVSTTVKQVKRLVLPDSTVVYLNANTTMEIESGFGKSERAVKLEGEAYFEVTRDTLKPFKVQTDGLVVQVLGTAFNVRAYNGLDDIQVAVSSGKVQVTHESQVLALLHAEEGLSYNRQRAKFQRMNISPTSGSSWKEGVSVLTDASFAMLAQVLHNHYGVTLESTDIGVRSTTFNLTIRSTRTLEQTLEQLSEMLKKKYRKEDDQVIIY